LSIPQNSAIISLMKPIILIILDGWGINPEIQGNAIAQSNTPTIKKLDQFYPSISLQASGIAVGLPWGEMGNSEVGHLNLGSGRVIYQNLPKITLAIRDKTFFKNKAFLEAIEHTRKNNSALHIMGLLSNGGVHSHIDHLEALLKLAKRESVKKLFIHPFTDGRDTSPTEGVKFIAALEKEMDELKIGKISTICGRYYAMDRKKNWDRTQKAYDSLTIGVGIKKENAIKAIKDSYEKDITDEFIEPTIIKPKVNIDSESNNEQTTGLISDNDAVVFFNFREDRARQLTKAFVLRDFKGFERKKVVKNLCFVSMTEYEKNLPTIVAFPTKKINWPIARVISENGLQQLHIAETEKYAHITYFFNGGREKPFKGEDRILIPSPQVATYDQKPEMSAPEITRRLLFEIKTNKYDFIVVNFANLDMVGHTGNLKAAIQAAEAIDGCLKQIIEATLNQGGGLIITADHGNAEEMINLKTGEILTEHTTNLVPFWLVIPQNRKPEDKNKIEYPKTLPRGILADVAPTILELMKLKKPAEMTGKSLMPLLK